jgi:catalase
VNYQPSRRQGSFAENEEAQYSQLPISGVTQQAPIEKKLNFQQAGDFYESLDQENREHLIANLATDLGQVKDKTIRTEMSAFFYKANQEYGTQLAQAVDVNLEEVQQRAAALHE